MKKTIKLVKYTNTTENTRSGWVESQPSVMEKTLREFDSRFPSDMMKTLGRIVDRGLMVFSQDTFPNHQIANDWLGPNRVSTTISTNGGRPTTASNALWVPRQENEMIMIATYELNMRRYVGDSYDSFCCFLIAFLPVFKKHISALQVHVLNLPIDMAYAWFHHADVLDPAVPNTVRMPNYSTEAATVLCAMCTRMDGVTRRVISERSQRTRANFTPQWYTNERNSDHWALALVVYYAIKTDDPNERRSWVEVENRAWKAMFDMCREEENEIITRVRNTMAMNDKPLSPANRIDEELAAVYAPFRVLAHMVDEERTKKSWYGMWATPLKQFTMNWLYENANEVQRAYLSLVDDSDPQRLMILGVTSPAGEMLGKTIKQMTQDFSFVIYDMPSVGKLPPWCYGDLSAGFGRNGSDDDEEEERPKSKGFWLTRVFSGEVSGVVMDAMCRDVFHLYTLATTAGAMAFRPSLSFNMINPILARMFVNADASENEKYSIMIFSLLSRMVVKTAGITNTSKIRARRTIYDAARARVFPRVMRMIPHYMLYLKKQPFEVSKEDAFSRSLEFIHIDMKQNNGLMFGNVLAFFILFCTIEENRAGMAFDNNDQIMALMNASMQYEDMNGDRLLSDELVEKIREIMEAQEQRQASVQEHMQDAADSTFFLTTADEIASYMELLCVLFENGRMETAFQLMEKAPNKHVNPTPNPKVFNHFTDCVDIYSGTVFERFPEKCAHLFEHVKTFRAWLANFFFLVEKYGNSTSRYASMLLESTIIKDVIPDALSYPLFFTETGPVEFGSVFLSPYEPVFDGASPLIPQLHMAFDICISKI